MNKHQTNVAVIGATVPRFSLDMCLGIRDGLKANGADARFFPINERDKYKRILDYYAKVKSVGRRFSIIDINGSVLEALPKSIPVKNKFSWIIDHPVFHLERIRRYDGEMILGFVDMIHMADRGDLGIEHKSTFLPHGDPAPDPDCLPMESRDIDILFCGNISHLITGGEFNLRIGGLPEKLATLVRESIEVVLAEHTLPFRTLRTVGDGHSVDLLDSFSLTELEDACSLIEDFITAVRRLEVLKEVSHLDVEMIGKLPDGVDVKAIFGTNSRIRFHGYKPFDEVTAMMKRTRILLNINPLLVGGSHERIWQAMAKGCVVATNESLFMRECFDDGGNIYISGNDYDGFAERLAVGLEDSAGLEDMAAAAGGIYARDHTWKSRGKRYPGGAVIPMNGRSRERNLILAHGAYR